VEGITAIRGVTVTQALLSREESSKAYLCSKCILCGSTRVNIHVFVLRKQENGIKIYLEEIGC
jgi:hypothetical protein